LSILFITVLLLGMTGLGYAIVMFAKYFEAPDLLKIQYHYWREYMREKLHE